MSDDNIPTAPLADTPPENDGVANGGKPSEKIDDNNNRGPGITTVSDKEPQVPSESAPTRGITTVSDVEPQVPSESAGELYDLSKPILKKVERPSKDEYQKDVANIDASIDSIREKRKSLQNKIDAALGKKGDENSPLSKGRDTLNKLKNQKGLMINTKRQIRTRLEVVKANSDRLIGQAKNSRGGMKFTNVSDIEKEIAKLQRKQETQSMSLSDEKKLIKEIEFLQASRRTAEDLASKQSDINRVKGERKNIQAELDAKNTEIDAIQSEIDTQAEVVKELMDKHSTQRGEVSALYKQKEELKTQLDAKFADKDDLRTTFRENTNDWYQCQRAIKAQRQLQYDEEKKRREEERTAWLKEKEAEELAKTPYEEEMALCDYLADYLTKTYLSDAQEEVLKKAKAAEEKAKADVVAVKDDPFAGFKAVSKKGDDGDVYFGKGKGKKKGKSRSSKTSKTAASFSINLDLFDQFGMMSLNPPTSLDAVPASVEELKAKKVWYSEQPRGSAPTARDIRKANEVAAKKSASSSGKSKNVKGAKATFSISNEEFVPLG